MENTKEDPIEKARAVADKIKADKAQEESQELAKGEEAKNQLEAIKGNGALADMYRQNATAGAENLGGETPRLVIHATGKSQNNVLADGSDPTDGYFFYKPTGEQFKEIYCHILTISRGFRAPGMNDDGKEVFNQLLGGVIIEEGGYKPFVVYFTGLKLNSLWEFGKLASKYTKARDLPIPMFALTVKLTTEKVDSAYGKQWGFKFEIVNNEDGSVKLISDQATFSYIRNAVDSSEEMIRAIIDSKAIVKPEAAEEIREANTIQAEPEVPAKPAQMEEVEDMDNLPF